MMMTVTSALRETFREAANTSPGRLVGVQVVQETLQSGISGVASDPVKRIV